MWPALDERLASIGKHLLQYGDVFAAALIEKRTHVQEAEAFEQGLARDVSIVAGFDQSDDQLN